jgi:hypothetical protein
MGDGIGQSLNVAVGAVIENEKSSLISHLCFFPRRTSGLDRTAPLLVKLAV